MANLNMTGPFVIDTATIDKEVSKTSAGNYALGKKNNKGGLTVQYVGRSDDDLNVRLKDYVNHKKYTHFKYSYATNAKAAFEEECRNYHDWGSLDNDIHPDRPKGKNYQCPYCDNFKE
ncbi:MAG: hypothetical protein GQ534_00120 [Candidatus Delongbacteria bacterium]|nr:hypothetical protein [Candidatus Delongbacteria bacterium]